MGIFSWKYANDYRKAMKIGDPKPSYLLVPPEFQSEYGEAIVHSLYGGYGVMAGYDVYDLVALWNRKYLSVAALKRDCKEFLVRPLEDCGLWSFEKEELREDGYSEEEIQTKNELAKKERHESSLRHVNFICHRIQDFVDGILSDDQMKEKYGDEYLREIGINIACDDEDNARLKYPIKIASILIPYEKARPSKSDPNQGL